MLNPQSSILNPRSSILDPQSSILNPRSDQRTRLRHMSSAILIATRESPLALWQAAHVQALLRALHPKHAFELLGMTTRGDQILDRSLVKDGGKGLFVKELETALLEGRARLAVHSFKDVPMQLAPQFRIAAVMAREDPRDALVLANSDGPVLAELPAGARIGTSSLRRELMLRAKFPHLAVLPVRGNVGSRLR
jgi:hydroxymethylbilane synthase